MRVAALTMVYNEPVWARVWVRHYSRQVGAENCLVLDHGTTDGSTSGLGVSVERLRRSALDEDVRAAVISDRVEHLLRTYDAVVHSDADELVVADPRRFADLRTYAAEAADVVTAAGLDLQHIPGEEPELDPGLPIGTQRTWVRFSGAMCKPTLVKRSVRWDPGFHGCDGGRVVGPLYLFHLRYADLGIGLARLERTRGQAFARHDANPHQRVADREFENMVRAIGRLPRVEGGLDIDGPLLGPWVQQMRLGWERGDGQLNLAGTALWRLPDSLKVVL